MSGWVCSGLLLPADSLGMIERKDRDRERQRQREKETEIVRDRQRQSEAERDRDRQSETERDRDSQRKRQSETEAERDNQKQRDKYLCSHIYTDCEGGSFTHNLTRVPCWPLGKRCLGPGVASTTMARVAT